MIKPSALLSCLLYSVTSYFLSWVNTNHNCPGKSFSIHKMIFIQSLQLLIDGKQNILERVPKHPYNHHEEDIENIYMFFPVMLCIDCWKVCGVKIHSKFVFLDKCIAFTYVCKGQLVRQKCHLFQREMLSSFLVLTDCM